MIFTITSEIKSLLFNSQQLFIHNNPSLFNLVSTLKLLNMFITVHNMSNNLVLLWYKLIINISLTISQYMDNINNQDMDNTNKQVRYMDNQDRFMDSKDRYMDSQFMGMLFKANQ